MMYCMHIMNCNDLIQIKIKNWHRFNLYNLKDIYTCIFSLSKNWEEFKLNSIKNIYINLK